MYEVPCRRPGILVYTFLDFYRFLHILDMFFLNFVASDARRYFLFHRFWNCLFSLDKISALFLSTWLSLRLHTIFPNRHYLRLRLFLWWYAFFFTLKKNHLPQFLQICGANTAFMPSVTFLWCCQEFLTSLSLYLLQTITDTSVAVCIPQLLRYF